MKQTTSALAARSPVQQAAPNPRAGSSTTSAPCARAIAADPSREPLSTTIGRYAGGMRVSTHGRARASSSTGRITSITARRRLGTARRQSHYDSLNAPR